MTSNRLEGFVLEEKPVFDWNREPVGTVVDMHRDPRTNAARAIVVNLTPAAQQNLGTDLVTIPLDRVFAIRRDGVTLDRSLHELRRFEVTSTSPQAAAAPK
ncbi:MAG: hypothetical protein ACYDDF_10090 [Thermoplasmatota archaeon]